MTISGIRFPEPQASYDSIGVEALPLRTGPKTVQGCVLCLVESLFAAPRRKIGASFAEDYLPAAHTVN